MLFGYTIVTAIYSTEALRNIRPVTSIIVISNTKIMEKVNPKYLGTLEHLWANNITENTRNAL